jgi:multidrug efflux pump subunit AcrB
MGGAYYQQHKGFGELALVMAASVFLIFLALVLQFNNAIKPFLVFAAAPYGVVGAVAALWIMDTPFGFMAFPGVAILIGVIVSHVIVLFDFIEEKHEEAEPFEEAVIDAGIIRLRPVMITVGATVLALFPWPSTGRALATALLHANRGLGGGHIHHSAAGSGAVCNFRDGSQDPEVETRENNRCLESPR